MIIENFNSFENSLIEHSFHKDFQRENSDRKILNDSRAALRVNNQDIENHTS